MISEPSSPSKVNATRILVVDDNPGTAATLVRAIARISPNLDVRLANDAETALKQLEGESIDLIITDMMMPGMSGMELIDRLRKRNQGNSLYSILITAYDVPGLRETARRMKIDQLLIKPFPPERICQIVARALERTQPGVPAILQPVNKPPVHRLLVADDNPSNLSLLMRYLQQEEYDIVTAVSGQESLEVLRSGSFDLALLDVNMPQMDGFQVLEQIRADPNLAHIPVIIVTAARLDPVDMQYALNLGADDYITKPFDRRELLARIRTRLRVKEAEDALRRRNRELNLLPEIGRELNAHLDVACLADVVLRRTVETLGALWGQLVLFEGTKPVQHAWQSASDQDKSFSSELPDLQTIYKTLSETHQGFLIQDTSKDPRWSMPGAPRSMVIAPIFGRSDLLGLLALTHKRSGYFLQEHVFLLQAIASQMAMAVENARLSATIKQEHNRLQAVLQNSSNPILIFDAHKTVALANPAAQKLFTNGLVEVGKPLSGDANHLLLNDVLEKAQASHSSQSCRFNLPGNRAVNLLITPIENGYVATAHEIL